MVDSQVIREAERILTAPRVTTTRHVFIGRGTCCLCNKEGRGQRIAINRGKPRLICRLCLTALLENAWRIFIHPDGKEE